MNVNFGANFTITVGVYQYKHGLEVLQVANFCFNVYYFNQNTFFFSY